MLRSKEIFTNICLGVNETKVVVGPEHGLEDNQEYEYAITAINSVGVIATDKDIMHCK